MCGLLWQGCAPRNPFLTQRAADPRRNHQAGARQPTVSFLSTAFSQRPRTAPCHGGSFPPQIQNLPSGMGQWSTELQLARGRRICIFPGLEVRHQRNGSFRVGFQEATSSRAFLRRNLAHLTTVRDPGGQDLCLKEMGTRKGTVFRASGCGAAGFRPHAFSILWRRLLTEFNNPTPQRRGGFGSHSQLVSLLMVLRWKINRHTPCGTPGCLDPGLGTRQASVGVSGGCLCGLGLWQNLLERSWSLRMYFILNSVGPHHAKKHFCPIQVLFLAK